MSLNKKLLHKDFLIFIDYKSIFISFKIHVSKTFYFEIIFESFRKKISEFQNKKFEKYGRKYSILFEKHLILLKYEMMFAIRSKCFF
jgi:hypothetical protein